MFWAVIFIFVSHRLMAVPSIWILKHFAEKCNMYTVWCKLWLSMFTHKSKFHHQESFVNKSLGICTLVQLFLLEIYL